MYRRPSGKFKGGTGGFPVAVLLMVLVMIQKASPVKAAEWSPSIDEHAQDFFGDPFKRAFKSLASMIDHSFELNVNVDVHQGKVDDTLLRYYLPSPLTTGNVSSKCRYDVEQIINAQDQTTMATIISKGSLWPILIPDSWGKVPDGLFSGNWVPLGMMEECTAINADDNFHQLLPNVQVNVSFSGRYCMVFYGLNGNPYIPEKQVAARFGGNPFLISGQIPSPFFAGEGGSSYGTCMPDSCSPEDFKISLDEVLQNGKEVWGVHCHTADETQEWEGKDYAFVSVFGVICFLVILGAAVDLTINYLGKQELRKGPAKYLLAFSGYSNMSKIFHINTKENPNNISCLHGIRVLSMTWVVWGHRASSFTSTVNSMDFPGMFDNVIGQTLLNAQLSVDSFFFLSGLLVGYGLMRSKNKMDLFNFAMFYVHRFLRLAPPIAAMGFFAATVARFFNTGPLGELYTNASLDMCNENWLYDFLFINNLNMKMCNGQTWYTSVDMQIYVLVPLLFFPLMYYGKFGGAWLMLMTVVSCIIPAVISEVYGFSLSWLLVEPEKSSDYYLLLYMAWFSRMTPYLVGLWTGYLIYRINKKPIKMELWQVPLGWSTASILGLLVVYGIYPYNYWEADWGAPRVPDQVLSDIYNGVFRGVWGLVLMWVVIACHTGYGGPVNSFLGHPSWQPLSRLTYGMFLTHIIVITLIGGAEFRFKELSNIQTIIETCGLLFISGIAAVILSLLVDSPIIGLEKLLLQRSGEDRKSKAGEKASSTNI